MSHMSDLHIAAKEVIRQVREENRCPQEALIEVAFEYETDPDNLQWAMEQQEVREPGFW